MKRLFIFIVMSIFITGCLEGPTGPKGEKGDAGQGIVEKKTFEVTYDNMRIDYSASLGYSYTISIIDSWFEEGCGYSVEQTTSTGTKWFITGGELNMLGVTDGGCVYGFTIASKMLDYGGFLTFYKIKPTAKVAEVTLP